MCFNVFLYGKTRVSYIFHTKKTQCFLLPDVNSDFFSDHEKFIYLHFIFSEEQYYVVQKSLSQNHQQCQLFCVALFERLWTTITSISFSFLLILPQNSASFFASHKLHKPVKPKNFQWVGPEHFVAQPKILPLL
jgi:hypothetical protein